jgi:putative restriction endonuclease
MKLYIGVTDTRWFRNLAAQEPPVADINFWKPGGGAFAALEPGCPFAFKLKSPINKIAGVGFFHSFTSLPLRLMWETFGIRNGRDSYEQIASAISQYRAVAATHLTNVGCILLENPVFFDEADWIDVPTDWSKSIMQGKGYDTSRGEGAVLWDRISMLLTAGQGRTASGMPATVMPSVFGKEYLRKSRPGQAGFRLGLLDAYGNRCAITGENIVPVLEAAHIQPVEREGTNDLTNGLVLRSDMHKLFDDGLIGIAPDRTVMVSKQIREQYVNGKVYYAWDGKPLTVTPNDELLLPSAERLEWHMKHVWSG